MLDRLESFAFSFYCSLILTSALLAAAPQSYQTAAMALPDAVGRAARDGIAELREAGWHVSAAVSPEAVPDATATAVSGRGSRYTDETGPLAKAAQIVFEKGDDESLSGGLATALGVTKNKERFPMKQMSLMAPENRQSLNASRVRGHIDLIFFYRTDNEGTLYLTSVTGELESAIHAVKGKGIQTLPLSVAKADFEKWKAWWLKQLEDPKVVASNP